MDTIDLKVGSFDPSVRLTAGARVIAAADANEVMREPT